MHRLGFRLTLATVAIVAASAWYHKGHQAQAAQDAVEAPVQLELAGLAVPHSDTNNAASTQAAASSVLVPSCDAGEPGACDRLQAICTQLQGEMTDNQDGTLTCLIVLD